MSLGEDAGFVADQLQRMAFWRLKVVREKCLSDFQWRRSAAVTRGRVARVAIRLSWRKTRTVLPSISVRVLLFFQALAW